MPPRFFSAAMAHILSRIPAPDKIIAALSGGMDSVVLLRLLKAWRDAEAPETRIVAAHLNHRLRGASADLDQEFAGRVAAELGVDFAVQSVDIRSVARNDGMGVEEAGRVMRYRFFHDLGGSGALVVTGHHADDQAETILLHLRRGAHRRGLSGMRPLSWVTVPPGLRVRVGRPLLGVGRDALRAAATANGWEWREDESNGDLEYGRNRIRHRIIPALEKIMPGFRDRLLAKAEVMAREEEELTTRGAALAVAATRREREGRFFRIDAEAMAEPERLLYAMRHVVEEELGARLPYGAALTRLSELAESGRLGETLSLPGRLRVRRERDGLLFFFPDRRLGDAYAEVILPDPPFRIRAYGMEISAEWREYGGEIPREDRDDGEVQWLNPLALRWPLRLRPPREGERFRPLGAPGRRKVQDILVDLKVPRRHRSLPHVVADYAGAVWLWPLRLAHRVALGDPPCRALRLEIRGRAE